MDNANARRLSSHFPLSLEANVDAPTLVSAAASRHEASLLSLRGTGHLAPPAHRPGDEAAVDDPQSLLEVRDAAKGAVDDTDNRRRQQEFDRRRMLAGRIDVDCEMKSES